MRNIRDMKKIYLHENTPFITQQQMNFKFS